MEYVIGCDVGSQAVKAILLSADGQIVGEASANYHVEYPKPAWAEQPAHFWTRAIEKAIGKLVQSSGVGKQQVRAIGLDAQVDGFVPVDGEGNPLRSAIIWMDRRSVAQIEAARQRCDPQRVFQITGLNFDPYHVAAKIRWFADTQADLYEKSAWFLLPGSYAAYHLSGELGVDYSNASSTLLMDVSSRQWSTELCECFAISEQQLVPIYPATQVLGTLQAQVAERIGLSQQTQIILGCGDEHAACLGAGVVVPGLVCDIAGTAEPVCAACTQPLFDASGLVETHCHADPDLWLLENPGFVSGGNYRWFREQFAPLEQQRALEENQDVYDLLNQLAEGVPPGSDGLIMLPTLMGAVTPEWNAYMRGVFLGFTLTHQREHFVRAILEASAYALRDITDQMQQMGLGLQAIRAVGGGARSALWRQIKANVTGLPVELLNTVETTALGAGMLALVGSGLVDTLKEAVEMTVRVVDTCQPQPAEQSIYEEMYQTYRQAFFAMLPVFEKAAK